MGVGFNCQIQKNFPIGGGFQFLPGCHTDFFDHPPLVSDNHFFVAVGESNNPGFDIGCAVIPVAYFIDRGS